MVHLGDTARLLKALGDENRLRLIHLLAVEELSVGELVEVLNLGQSRISAHLALLKEVGLVADRRLGRKSLYKLLDGPGCDLARELLKDADQSPEMQADRAGLEALLARRREEARSYFDRVAAAFGEQVLPGRTWEGLARGLLRLAPRARYVDLGIGDGLLTLMLAQVGERVTAVDLSTQMLDGLQQRAHKQGLDNIECVEGEIEELPLEGEQFDVAVLSQALHHARLPQRALDEAFRVLVPGGRVLVLDLLAHNEEWVRDKLQHQHLGFTDQALEEHLASAGFVDVTVQRAARDPHPPHFMTLLAIGHKPSA
ncbi:MAG: ArsR/SmtB family transcription factor [Planctomycetota bacterium]|jgi:ArsR family transcriptional regulator